METTTAIMNLGREHLAALAAMRQVNAAALDAITNGTHPMCALMGQSASKPVQPVALAKVGDVVADRGVYLGEWAGVHAYAAEDFLRKPNGEQLLLTFDEATKEFATRNGGRRYGEGSEANIRQAITQGHYQDGDLVLPSKELLHGRDVQENTTRADANIYALMTKGALPKVAAAVQNGEGDQKWALSGSEHPGFTSGVYRVRLAGGDLYWDDKGHGRSGVVPVRLYRNGPSAPQPTPGG